jgi:uncharacterized LabA/DUF88 family protein
MLSEKHGMRTNVYIDGFNLYYGCLKGTPYRWLNVWKLSERLLPQHEIHRVRYFTAKITAREQDPNQPQRQECYLRALQSIGVTVHLGHYLSHPVTMRLAKPVAGVSPYVRVVKTEEKGSDVNIASFLLLDGFKQDFEQAVVISNDSDLLTPITMVRQELGLPVGVVFPTMNGDRHPSQSLKEVATFRREIRPAALQQSLLPDVVDSSIHKPHEW